MTLAWPEASRDTVRVLSPVSERLDHEFDEIETVTRHVDADAAIESAAADLSAHGLDTRVDSLRVLPHVGTWAIRTFDARDVDNQGRLWTYVAMDDGRILGRRHDNGDSAGDMFFAWQYPLHSGHAFGLTGRILVFIGGVGTIVLCLTGVWLWWRRRWRWRSHAQPCTSTVRVPAPRRM